MSDPIVISAFLAIIAGLIGYAFFVPRATDSFNPSNEEEKSNNPLLKITQMLGGELYSTLPVGVTERMHRRNTQVKSLLVQSGNPWNLNEKEFVFFQWVTAFFGLIGGGAFWLLSNNVVDLPVVAVVIAGGIFGFFVPRIKYKAFAKERDLEFKRQLPDALDLFIISLSSGVPFNQVIRDSIPNMQPGILRDEFATISKSVDTGRTLVDSLDDFAERAPNESIVTFIRALQEAIDLNVPIIDVLESRAQASREDFFAVIHKRTATLDSKMMGILTPTLIPALLIVVAAPVIFSLTNSLG